jgi:hypothetical protein
MVSQEGRTKARRLRVAVRRGVRFMRIVEKSLA